MVNFDDATMAFPTEYKFHVVNGEVAAIDVIANRGTNCQCYASLDPSGERLDQYGCFEPGSGSKPKEGECSAINFHQGSHRCKLVKRDLPLCGSLDDTIDSCEIGKMADAAVSLADAVGNNIRVDMFIGNEGNMYIQGKL